MVGIPLGMFVFIFSSAADVSFSQLPVISDGSLSTIAVWATLELAGVYRLRCLLAVRVNIEAKDLTLEPQGNLRKPIIR